MGAIAHLETRLVPVTPGSQASVQIRVRNGGTVVDQFTFQVLGDAQGWAQVLPPSLSLFPGAEDVAAITFAPPRSSSVVAGQMPFGVHVVSKEDPQGSVVEEGVLDIAPFSDVFAELAPRTSRGSRGATHDLAIDNRGNAPVNATISGIDPDRLLDFDVRPPGIVAAPGTAAFAKVGVKARRAFWRGPNQTRPFHVLVEGAGPTPVTVDGTMVQSSILPPWLLRALLLLVGAIVVLILLWLFLLKPAIQSTAEQSTNDALAAAGISPAPKPPGPGATTAPQPNPNQSGAPQPNPAGSPGASLNVASAPPLSGGGQAADGRIAFNEPDLQVAQGKTLYVTDLVFSNASDTAVGALQLVRSGTPLLVLQLENFRDLDFHFVTPIVIPGGQTLGLRCGAQDQSQCGQSAVYYSGYQK